MIVSINQPAYLPWRPYFDRIAMSDLHIVLDHVQFEKGSFTNRTKIQLPDGRLIWLTVPVEKGLPINTTKIVGDHWRDKHLGTLWQTFGRSIDILVSPRRMLRDLLAEQLEVLRTILGIQTEIVSSSHLRIEEKGSALILALCREVEADVYLSGPLGRNYLDLPAFERAGIEVRFHDYVPPDPPVSVLHELFPRT